MTFLTDFSNCTNEFSSMAVSQGHIMSLFWACFMFPSEICDRYCIGKNHRDRSRYNFLSKWLGHFSCSVLKWGAVIGWMMTLPKSVPKPLLLNIWSMTRLELGHSQMQLNKDLEMGSPCVSWGVLNSARNVLRKGAREPQKAEAWMYKEGQRTELLK